MKKPNVFRQCIICKRGKFNNSLDEKLYTTVNDICITCAEAIRSLIRETADGNIGKDVNFYN